MTNAPLVAFFPQIGGVNHDSLQSSLGNAILVLHMLKAIRTRAPLEVEETPSSDGGTMFENLIQGAASWDIQVELGDDMIVPIEGEVKHQGRLNLTEQIAAVESLRGQDVLVVTSKHKRSIRGVVLDVELDDDYNYDGTTAYTITVREVRRPVEAKVRQGEIVVPEISMGIALAGLDDDENELTDAEKDEGNIRDISLNESAQGLGIADCIRLRAEVHDPITRPDPLRSHFVAGPIISMAEWLGNAIGTTAFVLSGGLDAKKREALGITEYATGWTNVTKIQDPDMRATMNVFFEQLIAAGKLKSGVDYTYIGGDLLVETSAYYEARPPKKPVRFEECFTAVPDWRTTRTGRGVS